MSNLVFIPQSPVAAATVAASVTELVIGTKIKAHLHPNPDLFHTCAVWYLKQAGVGTVDLCQQCVEGAKGCAGSCCISCPVCIRCIHVGVLTCDEPCERPFTEPDADP